MKFLTVYSTTTYKLFYLQKHFKNIRLYNSIYSKNAGVLMDLFGLSKQEAHKFIRSNPTLISRDAEDILLSYNFCKEKGFSNNDMLENSNLMSSPPTMIAQYFWAFEETGCYPIHPLLLGRAKVYMRKKISHFKMLNFLDSHINVVDQFLSYIQPSIPKPPELDNLAYIDDHSWTDVHKRVVENWLKIRLNATDEEIVRLFQIHKMFRNKSFRVMEENIQFAESLGLSHKKILKCGYLLNNYPEYPKTVLRDFPNLAGVDMRYAMKINPKLIMVNPRTILKIYGILKEYNVDDKCIQKKHQIFTMNVDTVRLRLSEIERNPELKMMSKYDNILHLVIHHKKVTFRLSFLQRAKLKCSSFQVFKNLKEKYFENYIKEGKDINQKYDVSLFLAALLEKDRKSVSEIIERHPFYQFVPFSDMHDTYNHLINKGYSKESVFKVLYLLLYPGSKIDEAIETIKNDKDIDYYKLNQEQILRLAVYNMEKVHHFSGNGIWNNVENVLE